MYRILKELIGKSCTVRVKSADGFGIEELKCIECTVLDCDGRLLKLRYTEKKKGDIIKIIRIENIFEVYLNEKIEEL